MLTFGQSRIKETHLKKKKKKKNVDIMFGTQQIFRNEWWSLAKNPSFFILQMDSIHISYTMRSILVQSSLGPVHPANMASDNGSDGNFTNSSEI